MAYPYPILMNDGNALHYAQEATKWVESQGINPKELLYALDDDPNVGGFQSQIKILNDVADEHEMCADGNLQNLQALIQEMESLADRLESGKKGTGYTKSDIAAAIRTACKNAY